MRSSSAFERDSPMDFTSSRNSFDCPNPPCDPIASSRPIVFNCSIFWLFSGFSDAWDRDQGFGSCGTRVVWGKSQVWGFWEL
ncbi:hypothetical protein HKD37_16G045501 [Glycine soja]